MYVNGVCILYVHLGMHVYVCDKDPKEYTNTLRERHVPISRQQDTML